jgi:RhoGEF domain
MATTCLPAIVPSPFGKTFTRKLYKYSDLNQNCSKNVGDRHDDYLRGSPQTPRAVSTPLSSSPAEITNRQENSRNCYYHGRPSTPPSTRACPLNAAHPGAGGSIRDALPPAEQTFEQTETFPIFEEDPLVSIEEGFHGLPHDTEANRSSDQSWSWPIHDSAHFPRRVDDGTSNPTEGNLVPPKHEESEVKSASTIIFDNSLGKRAESFRRWASSFRHKRSQHRHHVEPRVMDTKLQAETAPALPPSSLRQKWHQKRISNASSRFVATVKTASLSSDSMSLLPRSRRYSRVSDTRATRIIDPRSSVESRRPSSISSSDEGALRRSIKRRQILREILSSEESYVADLKALHNLFSTLLASVPSISTQTRNSIQRNVAEMLQLHEQIVNELHRIALQATLHEWKGVASPLRTVSRRRGKCQSLHAKIFYASMPKPGDRGFSPDLVNIRDLADSTYGADPVEVAEVAQAFKSRIAQFFVYEEYCAKYEIMVQELASSYKMVPQWSSYEAGMEALANSIASLNERGNDNRKALTAGDLLIKPIQRICKYPLFFDDLHRNTPAVDCPTSHVEVDGVLSNLREMVREINMATDDPKARQRIQRRWLLQDRLKLGQGALKTSQFRMLGDVLLCGILYLAYQTKSRVEGGYMLCMMFRDYLVIAAPAVEQAKFDILATIYLCDARVVSTKDGRGTLSTSYQLSPANRRSRLTMPYRPFLVENRVRVRQSSLRAHVQRMLCHRTAAMVGRHQAW